MLPMKPLRLALGTLLAADPDTLAPASNANKMALIVNSFALTEDLLIGDLTFASFTDSTPIAGATGAQNVGVDPVTGAQVVEIKPPAGGYRWVTGSDVGLPVTVYGYALVDSTLAELFAVGQLPTPITLTEAGQFIDIDSVIMTFVQTPIS